MRQLRAPIPSRDPTRPGRGRLRRRAPRWPMVAAILFAACIGAAGIVAAFASSAPAATATPAPAASITPAASMTPAASASPAVPDTPVSSATPAATRAPARTPARHATPAPPEAGAASAENAPVRFGAADLFEIMTPQGILSPQERADLAARRLKLALRDPLVGPEQVVVSARDGGALVEAGPWEIVEIAPAEAAAHGSTPVVLANLWADLIRGELGRRKNEALSLVLVGRFLLAMLYPVAIGLLLWIGLMALERIREHLRARPTEAVPGLTLFGVTLLRPLTVKMLAQRALGVLRVLLYVSLGYALLLALFSQFPLTQTFTERMVTFIVELLAQGVSRALALLPRVVAAALILLAARLVLKLAGLLFARVRAGRLSLPPFLTADTAAISSAIFDTAIVALTVALLAILIPGESGWPILAVLLLAGLVASLALGPVARQAMAGVLLAYVRPAPRGSRIEIEGARGTVQRRGLLHTIVRVDGGEEVWVPNHLILTRRLIRFPASDAGTPSAPDPAAPDAAPPASDTTPPPAPEAPPAP
jgi:Mechanosensitive ion channel, beta-domain